MGPKAKNGYCILDGRRATWPSSNPVFCTKDCAAVSAWSMFDACADGTTHCCECGGEATDGDCYNPKCDGYAGEIEPEETA
jgi:hypothetical protein